MPIEYLKISFTTYEKFFLEALNVKDTLQDHPIFYKKTNSDIEIYFPWSNFNIKTSISLEEIKAMYEGVNFNITDVRFSQIDDEPMIKKFHKDYLLNRGIPLAEED